MVLPIDRPLGFLVLGILLCAGLGFSVIDLYASQHGYDWSSQYYISYCLTAIAIGAICGLTLGLILDATVRDPVTRVRLIAFGWTILGIAVLGFALVRPALEVAR